MRIRMVCALISALLIASSAYGQTYDSVTIVSPEPETTVHDNSGNLSVKVAVAPPLQAGSGHHFTLLLDGNAVASGSSRRFKLTSIDRGAHTLQVQVQAADGTVLVSSQPVQFYMWEASRLFPGRAK